MSIAIRSRVLGFTVVALLAAGVVALPNASRAADPDKPTYDIGLYLWGASLATKIETEQFDASSHISFSDILSNLNGAVMARARANFGKASVVFDGEYLGLESSNESKTVNVGPGPGVDITGTAKAKLQAYILELNSGYQVFNVNGPFSKGPGDDRGARGELYVGARYYSLKPELKLSAGAASRDLGHWVSWVDGLVGARVFVDLSKTVVLGAQGDIGGFNIGNSSNLAFSQVTSLSWNCTDSVTFALGYKFLNFRKQDSTNTAKEEIRGPFIASFYRF